MNASGQSPKLLQQMQAGTEAVSEASGFQQNRVEFR
jgi:hypothetical protein